MGAGFNKKVDYDRICVECSFHKYDRKRVVHQDMCSRPVNIIDGSPAPVSCAVARAVDGSCGPAGRQYSARANVARVRIAEAAE